MSKATTRKAEKLYTSDCIKLLSKGLILKFVVRGSTENYECHYDRELKKWSCTCKWFSLKQSFCSHIMACHLMLQHEKDLIGL